MSGARKDNLKAFQSLANGISTQGQFGRILKDLELMALHESSPDVSAFSENEATGSSETYGAQRRPLRDSNFPATKRAAFTKVKIPISDDKENGIFPSDESHTHERLSVTSSSIDDENNSSIQTSTSNPARLSGGRYTRRKVSRKRDGEVHVYDETFNDTASEASDITILENRLRELPLQYRKSSRGAVHDGLYEDRDRERPSSAVASNASKSSRLCDRPWENCSVSSLPAFIRPSSTHPHTRLIRKCDPVARYHQFKDEWKNNQVPVQKKRSTLRWNIREQMLNRDTVFERPRRHVTSNDYVVPTSKKRQALRWKVRSALASV